MIPRIELFDSRRSHGICFPQIAQIYAENAAFVEAPEKSDRADFGIELN